MKLFGGTANQNLTQEVCQYLGIPPGKMMAKTFSDGETQIEIHENTRGMDVFVLQSTCTPVNDNLMQLLIIMDALRRASAKRITAIIPYYGYGRQDRKVKPRVPITAKLVADLITTAGADRVVSMDLHADRFRAISIFLWTIFLPRLFFSSTCGPTTRITWWSFPGCGRGGARKSLCQAP